MKEQDGSITDVDYLEVEVIPMPITGLSFDFMWRISKPVACVLDAEPIKLSHSLTQPNKMSYDERLKEALMLKWKELLATSTKADDVNDLKAKAMIEKWHNISEVKLFTLNLVRDENSER